MCPTGNRNGAGSRTGAAAPRGAQRLCPGRPPLHPRQPEVPEPPSDPSAEARALDRRSGCLLLMSRPQNQAPWPLLVGDRRARAHAVLYLEGTHLHQLGPTMAPERQGSAFWLERSRELALAPTAKSGQVLSTFMSARASCISQSDLLP